MARASNRPTDRLNLDADGEAGSLAHAQAAGGTDRPGGPAGEKLGHCLTPAELAQRWRVKVATVRAMIRRGELPAIEFASRRLNGKPAIRITPEAIAAAELGPLAVVPPKPCKQETASKEIREMLGI